MGSSAARTPWVRHPKRRRRGGPPPRDPPITEPSLDAPPPIVLEEPVRLVAPTVESPFAPGREVAFSRVEGSLLEGLGVRDGDHVALARRDAVEHGDLAAVVGSDGRAALWKVYPERESLRLSCGDAVYGLRTSDRPRVQGVVVGVLRRFSTT